MTPLRRIVPSAVFRPIRKKTVAGQIARLIGFGAILSTVSAPLMAEQSEWDCRVSADGTSWDCYRDGELVMQPLPQAEPAPVLDETVEAVTVPDAVASEPAVTTDSIAPAPIEAAVAEPPIDADDEPAAVDEPAVQVIAEPVEAEKKQPVETVELDTAPIAPVELDTPAPEVASEAEPDVQPETAAEAVAEPLPEAPTATVIVTPQVATSQLETETDTTEPVSEPVPEPIAGPITDPVSEPGDVSMAEPAPTPTFCAVEPRRVVRPNINRDDAETLIDADDAVMDEESGIVTLAGNISLTNADRSVQSDRMQFNTQTSELTAEGNLVYQHSDLKLLGESAQINLDNETGKATTVTYSLPGNDARGSADEMELLGDGVSRYLNATYTTCDPGNDDWLFTAAEVELNQETGVGTASDIKLFFHDTTIAYLPWATFPIDDRRKSGFLVPSVGHSDKTGFDLTVPYYFNLAPNYDFTFSPRFMSERGLLLGGEFRYLDERNDTEFRGEYLPDDQDYDDGNSRGAISLEHKTRFNRRLRGSLDINYVSDDTYLEDLGGSLAVSATRYLERTAKMTYNGDWYRVRGTLQQYQTTDEDVAKRNEPYKKLPEVTFEARRYLADSDWLAEVDAEYTYFDHTSSEKVKGGRLDLKPSVALDYRRTWGYLKPKLTLRYTDWDLDDNDPTEFRSQDRTTSTFSFDSGLLFERQTSWFGNRSTQTLEPRLFYLYTPEEDQDDIPRFDTNLYTFDYSSLFRENRFTGADRVGDANQLTLAMTTRFLSDDSPREYLNLTVGQILFFEDREVTLNGGDPIDDDASSFVATLSSSPNRDWLINAALQVNEEMDYTEKASFRVKYEDEDKRLFSARYQLDNISSEPLEYVKLSAYWPVAFNTRLVGHSYYSFEENRSVESVLGFEHGSSCCWRLRMLAREYQIDEDDEDNLSFYMQLELSGFAQIGDDIDSFLERTIEGFVRERY